MSLRYRSPSNIYQPSLNKLFRKNKTPTNNRWPCRMLKDFLVHPKDLTQQQCKLECHKWPLDQVSLICRNKSRALMRLPWFTGTANMCTVGTSKGLFPIMDKPRAPKSKRWPLFLMKEECPLVKILWLLKQWTREGLLITKIMPQPKWIQPSLWMNSLCTLTDLAESSLSTAGTLMHLAIEKPRLQHQASLATSYWLVESNNEICTVKM